MSAAVLPPIPVREELPLTVEAVMYGSTGDPSSVAQFASADRAEAYADLLIAAGDYIAVRVWRGATLIGTLTRTAVR